MLTPTIKFSCPGVKVRGVGWLSFLTFIVEVMEVLSIELIIYFENPTITAMIMTNDMSPPVTVLY